MDAIRRSQTVQTTNVGTELLDELLGCLVKLLLAAIADEQPGGILGRSLLDLQLAKVRGVVLEVPLLLLLLLLDTLVQVEAEEVVHTKAMRVRGTSHASANPPTAWMV